MAAAMREIEHQRRLLVRIASMVAMSRRLARRRQASVGGDGKCCRHGGAVGEIRRDRAVGDRSQRVTIDLRHSIPGCGGDGGFQRRV